MTLSKEKLTSAIESLMRHPASYFGNSEAQEVAASLRELLERRERDKQEPVAQIEILSGVLVNERWMHNTLPNGWHDLYAAPPAPQSFGNSEQLEPVSQSYKLVGEVVAWDHPTKERSVDFRWLSYDVAPGTKLYAMGKE